MLHYFYYLKVNFYFFINSLIKVINSAFLNDGVFIQNQNGQSSKVTQIVHISTNPCPPTALHPRTIILAEPGSESTILECHISLTDTTHLTNNVTEIILNENSHVTYYQLLNQNPESYQINSTHVFQKQNSTFESVSIAKGSSILRNEMKIMSAWPARDRPGQGDMIFISFSKNDYVALGPGWRSQKTIMSPWARAGNLKKNHVALDRPRHPL